MKYYVANKMILQEYLMTWVNVYWIVLCEKRKLVIKKILLSYICAKHKKKRKARQTLNQNIMRVYL